MVKKKYIGIMFLLSLTLFLIPFSLAIQSMETQKINSCVNIPQICSTCTFVNLSSIQLPDSTILIYNSIMEKSGVNYNYTFCNTSQLGIYIITTCGDKDGIFQCATYEMPVTTTGNNNNNTVPLFLGLGGFILLIFAFVLRNNYLGFMTGVLFIILGVYVIIYGLGFISDLYTQSIAYVSIGLGLFIFLASAYAAINDTGITLLGKRDDGDDDF